MVVDAWRAVIHKRKQFGLDAAEGCHTVLLPVVNIDLEQIVLDCAAVERLLKRCADQLERGQRHGFHAWCFLLVDPTAHGCVERAAAGVADQLRVERFYNVLAHRPPRCATNFLNTSLAALMAALRISLTLLLSESRMYGLAAWLITRPLLSEPTNPNSSRAA